MERCIIFSLTLDSLMSHGSPLPTQEDDDDDGIGCPIRNAECAAEVIGMAFGVRPFFDQTHFTYVQLA